MEIQSLLVNRKALTCQSCDIEFYGYADQSDEKTDAPTKLYECGECNALFSLKEGDVEERILDHFCPDCNSPLEETLEYRKPTGNCPMCGDRNFHGQLDSDEVQVETYCL